MLDTDGGLPRPSPVACAGGTARCSPLPPVAQAASRVAADVKAAIRVNISSPFVRVRYGSLPIVLGTPATLIGVPQTGSPANGVEPTAFLNGAPPGDERVRPRWA